jgi:hypothetical protein
VPSIRALAGTAAWAGIATDASKIGSSLPSVLTMEIENFFTVPSSRILLLQGPCLGRRLPSWRARVVSCRFRGARWAS